MPVYRPDYEKYVYAKRMYEDEDTKRMNRRYSEKPYMPGKKKKNLRQRVMEAGRNFFRSNRRKKRPERLSGTIPVAGARG